MIMYFSMNFVVSTILHVMHLLHNISIVNIDQIAFTSPPLYLNLDHMSPLSVYSVSKDTAIPSMSYVSSYPMHPIDVEKEHLNSWPPS